MIYLDYQATTPLAPEARAAMLPWLGEDGYANPHSPHAAGRRARAAIEAARAEVAVLVDPPGEGHVLFTSGATEAVNWALKGTMALSDPRRRKVVTIATEHACVLDTTRWLEAQGDEAIVLPVARDGLVDLSAAAEAIDGRTAVVAAMLVNNEIGVVQPIETLGRMAREAGAMLLCDAVQGIGRVPLPIGSCDLVAISAHKIHGPKGVGALWLRDGVALAPLLHGGGQEGGSRSGTLSPLLCAGFGAAARLMRERGASDAAHVVALRDRLRDLLGDWTLNGATQPRYAGNLNLRRDDVDAARMISGLREVALSAGSACASGSGRPSHVLAAIGLSAAQARASLRLGFGRYTTFEEIERAGDLIAGSAADQLAWA